MNLIARAFLCFICCTILNACNTTTIVPEPPAVSDGSYPSLPDDYSVISSIQIPITIPLSLIAQKLNEFTPNVINIPEQPVNCPETPLPRERNCRVTGHINIGTANFGGSGNTINYTNQIGGRITFLYEYKQFFEYTSDDKNLHFNGTINLNASPNISANWEIVPNLTGSLNFHEACVHFGPKVSVRTLLKEQADPLLNKELQKIGGQIASQLSLKTEIMPLWQSLGKPLSLTGNVWATLQPTVVYFQNPHITNDQLQLNVGLDFKSRTYVGSEPQSVEIGPLPSLSQRNETHSRFNFLIPATVQYAELSKVLNDSLANQSLTIDDNIEVNINSLELYGDSKHVYLKTNFKANYSNVKAKGVLYLKGSPKLDTESQTLRVANIDFDIKTKNILFESAEWLVKESLVKNIEEKAVINLTDYIGPLKEQFNQQLENLTIADKLVIQGVIDRVALKDVLLGEKGLTVLVEASGTTKTQVISLNI